LSVYPETFGALKRSAFGVADRRDLSVKDELRGNLLTRLATRKSIFNGLVGYVDTVMPLDVHALRLRRRLDSVGLVIRTVRSRGYLLEARGLAP